MIREFLILIQRDGGGEVLTIFALWLAACVYFAVSLTQAVRYLLRERRLKRAEILFREFEAQREKFAGVMTGPRRW